MGAMCENGHELVSGESRCSSCGARIAMQWMRSSTATSSAHDSSPDLPKRLRTEDEPGTTWIAYAWALFGLLAVIQFLTTGDNITKYTSAIQVILAAGLVYISASRGRRKSRRP